jgi:hypothetical protein
VFLPDSNLLCCELITRTSSPISVLMLVRDLFIRDDKNIDEPVTAFIARHRDSALAMSKDMLDETPDTHSSCPLSRITAVHCDA